jgi:glycerol-3-phosphate dehydrogenase (NAD(P)+)
LLATCLSEHSRNRTLGDRLARGEELDEITADMRMVAEGVGTAPVAMELADRHGIELPIAAEVHAVLTASRTPAQAFRGLLRRAPTTELAPG